jgi:hypothetical protein
MFQDGGRRPPLMRSARYDDSDPRLAAGAWEVLARSCHPGELSWDRWPQLTSTAIAVQQPRRFPSFGH